MACVLYPLYDLKTRIERTPLLLLLLPLLKRVLFTRVKKINPVTFNVVKYDFTTNTRITDEIIEWLKIKM